MSKRRYGQGGLYKRGRTWWLKYYVNRYPVYESARTQDKKEAENVLKKRLAEVELNQVPTGQSRALKVEELLRLLISDYSVHKRASVRQLVSRVDLHLSPLLGPVRAQEFGLRHVSAYVEQRRKQDASDATINRELEHLRTAFRLGVDSELLPKAPKFGCSRKTMSEMDLSSKATTRGFARSCPSTWCRCWSSGTTSAVVSENC